MIKAGMRSSRLRILAAAFAVIVAAVNPARAAACLHSAAGAKAGGAPWASYTLRLHGHHGERCWYPATRELRHVHSKQAVSRTGALAAKDGQKRPSDVKRHPPFPDLKANVRPRGRWQGVRLTVWPEDDPALVHWFLGDTMQAAFETAYAGRERRSSLAGLGPGDDIDMVRAAGWRLSSWTYLPLSAAPNPPGRDAMADSPRLTSIWIARHDVSFP